jgi:hypothetical protein
MPHAFDSAFHPAPGILTPPTGARPVSRERAPRRRRRHHKKKNRFRDILRADPSPWHLIVAAAFYWVTPSIVAWLQNVSLPHDTVFAGVVYLMWSGSAAASRRMLMVFDAVMTLELTAAGLLVASALLPRERVFAPVHAIARYLYRYAIAVALWTIVVAGSARFLADQVFALGGIVPWNLTPIFAKIEAPAIERLQHALASPSMSVFASTYYSAIWLAPIVLAGFALIAADRPRALSSLIVAYVVTAVSAIPLFILFPTFDPWTTNSAYGAVGTTTSIKYLAPNGVVSALTRINARYHWAAGAAFPSLHVALPFVASLVLRRHRLRWASLFMTAMAATSMFVVVFLGRNWILSTLAAIPFALATSAVSGRLRPNFVLDPRRERNPVLRPGEIALPTDPNAHAVEWYSAMFFLCAFAGMLSQIAWQRTLFDFIGLGAASGALVAVAVMVGLGLGLFIGARFSEKPLISVPSAFCIAQIAVGLFCFVSIPFLHALGRSTMQWGFAAAVILAFVALLPPTALAGALMPLLVANHVRLQRSVGDAVGRIVFMGALGAAAAAACAALVLLGPLGLSATVQVAGVLNVGIGILVYAREHRVAVRR